MIPPEVTVNGPVVAVLVTSRDPPMTASFVTVKPVPAADKDMGPVAVTCENDATSVTVILLVASESLISMVVIWTLSICTGFVTK